MAERVGFETAPASGSQNMAVIMANRYYQTHQKVRYWDKTGTQLEPAGGTM
jgi:hypothetical protein